MEYENNKIERSKKTEPTLKIVLNHEAVFPRDTLGTTI